MVLGKTKWIKLSVVVCFAILQALQPFIHAHSGAGHSTQNTGFHVGAEHEAHSNASDHLTDHFLSDVSHTVSVASGIKQDVDLAFLIDAVSFALLGLCFAVVIQSVSNHFPPLTLAPHKPLKRRLPASRAPPQSWF